MTVKTDTIDPLVRALVASGDLAYDWDLTSDQIRWSGAVTAVLGIGTAGRASSGRGFAAQVHPDDRSDRLLALARHLDRSEAYDCVYRLSCPRIFWTPICPTGGIHDEVEHDPNRNQRCE